MSCGFSREALALFVEGDLPGEAWDVTVSHLAGCEDCRRFFEELQASQALVKSVRHEAVQLSACTAMRREVMTIINERPGLLGWRLRIERALALGLRPSYAMAMVLLAGIVSVSLLAQIRPATQVRLAPAVLDGADTLLRPEGFRHWTVVGGEAAAGTEVPGKRVYINQSSYRAYAKTGIFPEGTVFVWEGAGVSEVEGPHATSATLLATVKDSTRFEGGWGFFDFSSGSGEPLAKARALPESRGCRTCHRQSPLSMGA